MCDVGKEDGLELVGFFGFLFLSEQFGLITLNLSDVVGYYLDKYILHCHHAPGDLAPLRKRPSSYIIIQQIHAI